MGEYVTVASIEGWLGIEWYANCRAQNSLNEGGAILAMQNLLHSAKAVDRAGDTSISHTHQREACLNSA